MSLVLIFLNELISDPCTFMRYNLNNLSPSRFVWFLMTPKLCNHCCNTILKHSFQTLVRFFFMHVCVCTWCGCVHGHESMCARPSCVILSNPLMRCFLLAWEPQWSSCFHLCSPGITGAHHHAWPLYTSWDQTWSSYRLYQWRLPTLSPHLGKIPYAQVISCSHSPVVDDYYFIFFSMNFPFTFSGQNISIESYNSQTFVLFF